MPKMCDRTISRTTNLTSATPGKTVLQGDQTRPPTFCSGNQLSISSAVGYSQAPLCLLLTDFSKTTKNCAIHLKESRFILNTCLSKCFRRHKQIEDKSWKGFRLSPYFLPKRLNVATQPEHWELRVSYSCDFLNSTKNCKSAESPTNCELRDLVG